MSKRTDTAPNTNMLPLLAALVLLCLAAAAALTALNGGSAPVAAPAEQLSLLVQRMPFEAQNALRGESSAFDALVKTAARLKTLRAAVPGSGDAATFVKLNDAAVSPAGTAAETVVPSAEGVSTTRGSSAVQTGIEPACSAPPDGTGVS